MLLEIKFKLLKLIYKENPPIIGFFVPGVGTVYANEERADKFRDKYGLWPRPILLEGTTTNPAKGKK